jgi:hypothetical protein
MVLYLILTHRWTHPGCSCVDCTYPLIVLIRSSLGGAWAHHTLHTALIHCTLHSYTAHCTHTLHTALIHCTHTLHTTHSTLYTLHTTLARWGFGGHRRQAKPENGQWNGITRAPVQKTACKKQQKELKLMHELRQTLDSQVMQTPKTLKRSLARGARKPEL